MEGKKKRRRKYDRTFKVQAVIRNTSSNDGHCNTRKLVLSGDERNGKWKQVLS